VGKKIAIVSSPIEGYNAGAYFALGEVFELREYASHSKVYSAAISIWNTGAAHSGAGDQVWWFDFSDFNTPGQYYVYDPKNNVPSHRFKLSDSIYSRVLKTAVRTFFIPSQSFNPAKLACPSWSCKGSNPFFLLS